MSKPSSASDDAIPSAAYDITQRYKQVGPVSAAIRVASGVIAPACSVYIESAVTLLITERRYSTLYTVPTAAGRGAGALVSEYSSAAHAAHVVLPS